MRYLSIAVLPAILLTAPALGEEPADEIKASRTAAKTFGMNLKGELQKAVKAGGPLSGIAVCNERAMQIAEDTSKDLGLEVGRTSLKVRNSDNAPDNWEQEVLQTFEERKAAGEPVGELEYYEIVDHDGGKTFRYMKAIPTAKVCLACHGDSLSAELAAKLDELYPDDRARGFKEGDIRGAFTISKPL
jgi:hypothetical protein